MADVDGGPAKKKEAFVTTSEFKRRVLLADDNKDAVESMAMLLELSGHDVHRAYSGPEALEIAARIHPEVIVLDIGMPGMDGYEVAKYVRQEPWAAGAKLIALTGWGQEDDKRQARAAGFDHYLVKPVDPIDLERLIESV
ncbi:MAG TPA: response regulator [Burkholderiales bacterium]|nr:response regulator [Burkholderiales bacterium]